MPISNLSIADLYSTLENLPSDIDAASELGLYLETFGYVFQNNDRDSSSTTESVEQRKDPLELKNPPKKSSFDEKTGPENDSLTSEIASQTRSEEEAALVDWREIFPSDLQFADNRTHTDYEKTFPQRKLRNFYKERGTLLDLLTSKAPIGDIDTNRLVDKLAKKQAIKKIPRKSKFGVKGVLQVLIVENRLSRFFETDLRYLLEEIIKIYGDDKVEIVWFPQDPLSSTVWYDDIEGHYRYPPAGSTILFISDFGATSVGKLEFQSDHLKQWEKFHALADTQHVKIKFISLFNLDEIPQKIKTMYEVFLWFDHRNESQTNYFGPLTNELNQLLNQNNQIKQNIDENVLLLATLISIATDISPALLREFRVQFSQNTSPIFEALLWYGQLIAKRNLFRAKFSAEAIRALRTLFWQSDLLTDIRAEVGNFLTDFRKSHRGYQQTMVEEKIYFLSQEDFSGNKIEIESNLQKVGATILHNPNGDAWRRWVKSISKTANQEVKNLSTFKQLAFLAGESDSLSVGDNTNSLTEELAADDSPAVTIQRSSSELEFEDPRNYNPPEREVFWERVKTLYELKSFDRYHSFGHLDNHGCISGWRDTDIGRYLIVIRCDDRGQPVTSLDITTLQEHADSMLKEQNNPSLSLKTIYVVEDQEAIKNLNQDDIERVVLKTERDLLNEFIQFEPYLKQLSDLFFKEKIPYSSLPLKDQKSLADVYIMPRFRLINGEYDGSLDSYVDKWLEESSARHLALLGDYGMGKSSYLKHLAARLAQKRLDGDFSGRIPLLIELGGKSPRQDPSATGLLADLNDKNRLGTTSTALRFLMRQGQLLVILDGFDEMDLVGDINSRRQHFEVLWTLAEHNNKILISGRPGYFPYRAELQRILSVANSQVMQGTGARYCTLINLDQFTTNDIQEAFRKYFGSAYFSYFQSIESQPQALTLAKRPALLHIILDSLQNQPPPNAPIKPALLLRTLTEHWLTREINKPRSLLVNETDRRLFSKKLATYLYVNEKLEITIDQLSHLYTEWFPSDHSHQILEGIKTDLRTCTFIIPNGNDTFKFTNLPFLEYFVAVNIKDFLMSAGHLPNELQKISWSNAICRYTADLLREDLRKGEISKIIDSSCPSKSRPARERTIANKRPNLLSSTMKLNSTQVELYANIPLQETHLGIDLLSQHQQNQTFFTNIRNAMGRTPESLGKLLDALDLFGANLDQIDLNRAQLEDANLRGVSLTEANLSEATLARADLTSADLSSANLKESSFVKSNLKNTHLLKSFLQNSNLNDANLEGANLQGASLFGSDLRNTNLLNAILKDADLRGANLNGAKVNDSQLKSAILDQTTILSDGSFWKPLNEEEFENGFGDLLRHFRRNSQDPVSGKPLTQARLADLISAHDERFYYGPSIVSRWERGERLSPINERDLQLVLIDILHKYAASSGMNQLEDANLLLKSLNWRNLSLEEATAINPNWVSSFSKEFETTRHNNEEKFEKRFSDLLRHFRRNSQDPVSGRPLTQARLADLISTHDERFYYDPSIISRWERGKQLGSFTDRSLQLTLIDVLHKYATGDGLNRLEDANLLLESLNTRDLSLEEATHINPNWTSRFVKSDPNAINNSQDNYGVFEGIFTQLISSLIGWLGRTSQSNAHLTYRKYLTNRFGYVQILSQTEPKPISRIYTDVYLLDSISSNYSLTIDNINQELLENRQIDSINRERSDGLDLVTKTERLFVLGKPGSGKTTFLKYLIFQALDGNIPKIPVFINLNELYRREETIINYLANEFDICNLPDTSTFVDTLLRSGKALILFDGLDEVPKDDNERSNITREIKDFIQKWDKSQFVITCRIAASDYNFNGFTYVEMADFTPEQVSRFVGNWFSENTKKQKGILKEFESVRNQSLLEMASSPILLTMLCILYDKFLSFPSTRSEIYSRALDTIFEVWDSSRDIKRDETKIGESDSFRTLSTNRKFQLLSRLAYNSFARNEIAIRQSWLESEIANNLSKMPFMPSREEIDGRIILKAIEAQHGILVERAAQIYSFSHITFQEFFTAQYITDHISKDVLNEFLNIKRISDPRWREVFLFVSEMLPEADSFITTFMEILEEVINSDEVIYSIFERVNKWSVRNPLNKQAVKSRANYLYLILEYMRSHDKYTDSVLHRFIDEESDFGPLFCRTHRSVKSLARNFDVNKAGDRARDKARDRKSYLLDIEKLKKITADLDLDELLNSLEEIPFPTINSSTQTWMSISDHFEKIKDNIIFSNWHFENITRRPIVDLIDWFECCNLLCDCLDNAVLERTDRATLENEFLFKLPS